MSPGHLGSPGAPRACRTAKGVRRNSRPGHHRTATRGSPRTPAPLSDSAFQKQRRYPGRPGHDPSRTAATPVAIARALCPSPLQINGAPPATRRARTSIPTTAPSATGPDRRYLQGLPPHPGVHVHEANSQSLAKPPSLPRRRTVAYSTRRPVRYGSHVRRRLHRDGRSLECGSYAGAR